MKTAAAVDVAVAAGIPQGDPAVFHATSIKSAVATTPTKKNGYTNGTHYHRDAMADHGDALAAPQAQGGNTDDVNKIYNLTDERTPRHGISNGKLSVDYEDLNQPDLVLTNGSSAGKRSEATNEVFYALSNGRGTGNGDSPSDVGSTALSVDLLSCEQQGAVVRNGVSAHSARLTEKGAVNGARVTGQDVVNGERATGMDIVNGTGKTGERISGMDALGMERDIGGESPTSTWDRAAAEMKEHAFNRLQEELKGAQQELKLRDEEVSRLSRIREQVEAELEDLTASLFQEAHKMVREANVKQASAERAYKESEMKIEVLTAEVSALKALVLTSTPSKPNPHLHPQIDLRGNRTKDDSAIGAGSLFNRSHRRSPSHFNLKYGRENSPPESPVKQPPLRTLQPETLESKDGCEVDPDVHREFVAWKENPKLDKSEPFVARVYREEIDLCLDFPNRELSREVRTAVEAGNIFIEAVSDKAKTVFPKKCALLDVPRQCHYRMRFSDNDQWYSMSQICRNRIIAVCEFLNYLKYIERGMVKSSVHDVYWEVTRLRKEMVLARLGLALQS